MLKPNTLQSVIAIRFVLALVCSVLIASSTYGQIDLGKAPINYLTATSNDPVAKFMEKMELGESTLEFDKRHGFLSAALKEFGVQTSSQVLVFSKTSLQLKYISPRTPRAIYFSDDVYVAWCQGGDFIEVSAVDPDLGAFFYTIDQHEPTKPEITRHTYNCLQCHSTSLTGGVPGHTIRSVYCSGDGSLERGAKTFMTDQTSPFKERWGGWYVSGKHGEQRHMGNVARRTKTYPGAMGLDRGANAVSLRDYFNTLPYLTRHSDIVALMVLEHQTKMHNLITQANYLTRVAAHDQEQVIESLGKQKDFESETFKQRVAKAGEPLVKYLLMSEEMEITDPIEGTSRFAKQFAEKGPFDEKGRSLRQFDLTKRLFKYPCSYLIYSKSFDGLPQPVKSFVYDRVLEVLTGQDESDAWKHLSKDDRNSILEILCATKNDLPPAYAEALAQ